MHAVRLSLVSLCALLLGATTAPDVKTLAQRAGAQFTWNRYDLLRITHARGHIVFIMDRAREVAPHCWTLTPPASSDPAVCDYVRGIDKHPIIIARNPSHGVVYQVRWDSTTMDGSGHYVDTRNLFLLCDAHHHWHFLGEGPVAERGAGGGGIYTSERVQAHVAWMHNPRHPVNLAYTLVRTHRERGAVTITRVPIALGLNRDEDAIENPPGNFRPKSP